MSTIVGNQRPPRLNVPALTVVLALAGCGGQPGETDLAAVQNKILHISGAAHDELSASLTSDGCPILRTDATATLNGTAAPLFRGQPHLTGMGEPPCTNPVATFYATAGDTATTLDLVLSDPTQAITARLVGYHPYRFEPGDLPSPTVSVHNTVTLGVLHANDTLSVAVPVKPEMPDQLTVSFVPRVSPAVGVIWTVPATLANGQVTFTIPNDSYVGQGQLSLCGEYSTKLQVDSCLNATCIIDGFTARDCRVYMVMVQ
jgi:hypothetical protein